MQRFAHQTFLSACVHAQADAPEGRRSVAAGGASPAAKRAKRNPWTHSHLNNPAPERAEEASRRKQNAEEQTCSEYRALVNAARESFAPPGRKGDDGPVVHGFRVRPRRGRAAPPVATTRRPSGAKARLRRGDSELRAGQRVAGSGQDKSLT